jgi:uncharacterized repeat protein (TIGR01451 family)
MSLNRKEVSMKPILTMFHPLAAVIAILTGAVLFGSATSSEANTSANTTILNVVRVDYKDAGGTLSFAATASSSVTVARVKAGLNTSGAPTGATGNPALSCLTAGSYASGSMVSSLYALTAAANGSDSYGLSIANTPSNAGTVTVSYSTRSYTGASAAANPASVTLGSAIPTGIKDAATLYFPGGALVDFAIDDVVLVDIAGAKKAFLVSAVTVGSGASHSNPGNVAQTTTGATTAEVKGELQLKAYPNQTVTLNGASVTFGGNNVAPAFTTLATAPTLGVPVGEMTLVQVDVTATATSTTLDGTVQYTLTSTDNGAPANTSAITCTVGNFKATALTITKRARNLTKSGSFGATATGAPGEILEYEVTVSNSGGQATQVVVTDAVPAYTTLVSFTGSYGGGVGSGIPANFFARIADNAASPTVIQVTMDGADSETQPLNPVKTGFGKAVGTAATSGITFYLGDTATNALGGKVPTCSDGVSLTQSACTTALKSWLTTYTVLYQVKID